MVILLKISLPELHLSHVRSVWSSWWPNKASRCDCSWTEGKLTQFSSVFFFVKLLRSFLLSFQCRFWWTGVLSCNVMESHAIMITLKPGRNWARERRNKPCDGMPVSFMGKQEMIMNIFNSFVIRIISYSY